MSNPHPDRQATSSDSKAPGRQSNSPTPLRCFVGALISCPFTIALYLLTVSIAQTFANKPIPSGNELAIKIAVLVRTLVMGISALGMGIFGITTLGLIALGIQLLVKKDAPASPQSSNSAD
ncbi:MAG: DUF3082 domain-containing protein [Elainellaceae cyanobacterium]